MAQQPIQAESLSQFRRLKLQGADVIPPPVQLQDQKSAPEWTCQECGGDLLFCGCGRKKDA